MGALHVGDRVDSVPPDVVLVDPHGVNGANGMLANDSQAQNHALWLPSRSTRVVHLVGDGRVHLGLASKVTARGVCTDGVLVLCPRRLVLCVLEGTNALGGARPHNENQLDAGLLARQVHGLQHAVQKILVHNHGIWRGVSQDVRQLVGHQARVEVHHAGTQPRRRKVRLNGLVNVWQKDANTRSMADALASQEGAQPAAPLVELRVGELDLGVHHRHLVWHVIPRLDQGIPRCVHLHAIPDVMDLACPGANFFGEFLCASNGIFPWHECKSFQHSHKTILHFPCRVPRKNVLVVCQHSYQGTRRCLSQRKPVVKC